MTLKQIFQMESILLVYLLVILKRLLKKIRLDASFMCLFPFVAFRVTFTIFAVERMVVVYCHAYNLGNGPKLADCSK